jgi:hypothetical protein
MDMLSPWVRAPCHRGRQSTCRGQSCHGENPDHRAQPAGEHEAIVGTPFLTVKWLHNLLQIDAAHRLHY